MSRSILREKWLGLHEIAKLVPSCRHSGHLTPNAIYRWATRGVRSASGQTIRLESVRVAGRILSSREALERFILAQSTPTETQLSEPCRTPAARRSASERAADALQDLGI